MTQLIFSISRIFFFNDHKVEIVDVCKCSGSFSLARKLRKCAQVMSQQLKTQFKWHAVKLITAWPKWLAPIQFKIDDTMTPVFASLLNSSWKSTILLAIHYNWQNSVGSSVGYVPGEISN